MTWGNNNAVGPVGVPPLGPNSPGGQMVNTGGGTATPLYNAGVRVGDGRGLPWRGVTEPGDRRGRPFAGNNAVALARQPHADASDPPGPGQNGTNGLNGNARRWRHGER